MEPSDRVRIGFDLTNMLDKLEQEGFFIFGALEIRMLEGGIQKEPSQFPVATIRVVRKDNLDIIDASKYVGRQK